MAQVIWHVQDRQGKALSGVLLSAISPNGDWQGFTDCAGNFISDLKPGHYDLTLTKAGYVPNELPADIQDCGIITRALQSAFPAPPSREAVCNPLIGFQGYTIQTKQYGPIPAWGPECLWLGDEDLISYCQQMLAFGMTHVEGCVSGQYDEPSYQYPVPGIDFSHNLPELRRRIELALSTGMLVKLSLAMDGRSAPAVMNAPSYSYNDPAGWTYGYEWGMTYLDRLLAGLDARSGLDLSEYLLIVPGYDGVFYGWGDNPGQPDQQPQRVIDFGVKFRSIWPKGYLGIEHTPGQIPVGKGQSDWVTGGPLDAYDTLLSEFVPGNVHQDSTWQVVARCVRPYARPPDQPTGDDPNPPFYLVPNTRGPRYYIRYEYDTYLWVRGAISAEDVAKDRAYLQAMAPGRVC